MGWIAQPGVTQVVVVDDFTTERPDVPVVYWRAPPTIDPENAKPGDLLYVSQSGE